MDETRLPVDNDTVHAFLDGDGADPEAFETLRRRITLAVPYILDSEVGRDYAVAKLADAEKRGAVKALRGFAKTFREENELTSRPLAGRIASDLMDRAHLIEHREVDFDGLRIESGEVAL